MRDNQKTGTFKRCMAMLLTAVVVTMSSGIGALADENSSQPDGELVSSSSQDTDAQSSSSVAGEEEQGESSEDARPGGGQVTVQGNGIASFKALLKPKKENPFNQGDDPFLNRYPTENVDTKNGFRICASWDSKLAQDADKLKDAAIVFHIEIKNENSTEVGQLSPTLRPYNKYEKYELSKLTNLGTPRAIRNLKETNNENNVSFDFTMNAGRIALFEADSVYYHYRITAQFEDEELNEKYQLVRRSGSSDVELIGDWYYYNSKNDKKEEDNQYFLILPKGDTPTVEGTKDFTVTLFDYTNSQFNAISSPLKFNNGQGDIPQNTWTNKLGHEGAYQGIMMPDLKDGLPVLWDEKNTTVFDRTEQSGKTIYSDVAFPFKRDANGYYEYDSAFNHAQFDASNKRLTIYDKALTADGFAKDYGGGFFPFNNFDQATATALGPVGQTVWRVPTGNINYHFGLAMEVEFDMPRGGKIKTADGSREPMVFEFKGDDDMWVFIDDKLVLDVGGIHNATGAKIDFAAGTATVENVFQNNGKEKTVNFKDIFGAESLENATLKSNTSHTMRIFYLERGKSTSNLKIRFNIPPKEAGSVQLTKRIANANPAISDTTLYTFQMYYKEQGANSFTPYTGDYKVSGATRKTDNNGNMYITGNQTLVIDDDALSAGAEYYFMETQHTTPKGETLYDTMWSVGDLKDEKIINTPQSPTYKVPGAGEKAIQLVCTNIYPSPNVPLQDLTLTKNWGANGTYKQNETFDFTIELKDEEFGQFVLYDGNVNYSDGSIPIEDGKVSLGVNDTLTIENLPVGTEYRITETSYDASIAEEPNSLQKPVFKTQSGEINSDKENGSITGSIVMVAAEEGKNGINAITCTNSRNRASGGVELHKVDDKNGAILSAEAKFTVSPKGENGTDSKEYVTKDGTLTFEVTEDVKEYIVSEVSAPEGFEKLVHSHTVTVEYDKETQQFILKGVVCEEGKSCDMLSIRQGKGSQPSYLEVRNKELTGSISITKEIKEFYEPHGNAVFFFKLVSDDGHTYYRSVEFNAVGEKAVTFDNLPLGEYTVTEENPIRYSFGSIENVSDNGKKVGESVAFTLTATEREGGACYVNDKVNNQLFSHTSLATNTITIQSQS